MPWSTVKLIPGLNVEMTQTMNQTGYANTQLGRFKSGLFQKIGGWTKAYPSKIDGDPKALHTWRDLASIARLAVGTTTSVNVLTNGILSSVQPQVLTTDTAVNLSTVLGSNIVTIVDTNVNNITAYDSVFFNTPIAVGGLVLSGLYKVSNNVSATSYVINAAGAATATVVAPGGVLPTFTTTAGSAVANVTIAAHGLAKGDDVVFTAPSTIGGLTFVGRYIVQSVIDADNFTITAAVAATASAGPTAMNGGLAQFHYYLAVGPQVAAGAYGSGAYGEGAYGTGTVVSGQTGLGLVATDWSLDNWGELLMASPEGGPLFYWGPASGYTTLTAVAEAPALNNGMFVSTSNNFVILYGSTQTAMIGVYQDPLLVKWCDAGDFFNWTLSATTQAGSYRISSGSAILAGASTQQRNLLWTDKDLWLSSYIGSTLVFNMVKVGEGAGIIGKHAWGKLTDTVYWMGQKNFFIYDSDGPRTLACPVWDAVFQDLNMDYASSCAAGVNKAHSEIFFFFTSISGGVTYPDTYVKYNIQEQAWDYGKMNRSAWTDSDVFNYPIAVTNDGYLYYHENGMDADANPLVPSFETGYFYIDSGRQKVFVDRLYPDFKWGMYNNTPGSSIQFTVHAIDELGDTPVVYGPYTATHTSPWIELRVRCRQLSLVVSSADIGSFWRLGAVRFRYSPDGRSGGS